MKDSTEPNSNTEGGGVSRWLQVHDGWLKLAQIIVIPLTLGLATFFLTYCNNQEQQSLAEDKRFVEIIDKLETTINTNGAQSISVDGRPAIGLTQKGIHELDSKVRIYLAMLGAKEKLRMLLFLYSTGFVKHSVADATTYPGTIGLCRVQPLPQSTLYCNITSSGLPLEGLEASGQSLRQIKLVFSSANGADFHNSDLYGAELMGTNLLNANFRRANLKRAYLISADLRNADLRGSNLSGTYFHCSQLAKAEFTDAQWSTNNPPKYNQRTDFGGKYPWEGTNRAPWTLVDIEKFRDCPYSPKSD